MLSMTTNGFTETGVQPVSPISTEPHIVYLFFRRTPSPEGENMPVSDSTVRLNVVKIPGMTELYITTLKNRDFGVGVSHI